MHLISLVRREATPIRVFLLTLLVVGFLAVGIYVTNERRATEQHARTNTEWSLIARPITANDHTIGPLSAPIQVIVYSSISCSYCRILFEKQVPRLQTAFGDQIVIAYRHNPVPSLPNAKVQEPASECVFQVGGNDAFWKFVHTLFPQAGRSEAADHDFLAGIAEQSGVSRSSFLACMQSRSGEARVFKDKQEAAIGGLTIDPSILLKSPHRALIIKGDYYSRIYAGIEYLIDAESQIERGR